MLQITKCCVDIQTTNRITVHEERQNEKRGKEQAEYKILWHVYAVYYSYLIMV